MPTPEELKKAWDVMVKRREYHREYAKKRRAAAETAEVVRANQRNYYWANREKIRARRNSPAEVKLTGLKTC
jgi:hypothetical protein